jgi:uncharacterized protein
MTKLEDIIKHIKGCKSELVREYNVKEIGIFGSCVRGESNELSDIDILVDFHNPIDLFKFLELEDKLSEVTNGKVDLVSKKALKPEIGKIILQEVQYL